MLFAYGCLFLSTVIKLNLCIILIEFLKTLQVVGLEGACQFMEYRRPDMCWRKIKFCGYVNGMEIGLNYTKAKLVYFDIKPNTIRVLIY